ncbi:unnamed protein product [Onchocerca flexuosa]|uniref:Uncharacterized protein n=1 Tax=Onchocerca flexuosa TaxID=387005 RepID=A0A183H741_9BILA|nr:unnamed protein product [Onchocerca flexuosa]
MCCIAGKIKLSQLEEPSEPLLAGYTAESKRFLSKIRKCKSVLPIDFIRRRKCMLRNSYRHRKNVNDGNTTNVGRLTILPSSSADSPRHMHEYAQDQLHMFATTGV